MSEAADKKILGAWSSTRCTLGICACVLIFLFVFLLSFFLSFTIVNHIPKNRESEPDPELANCSPEYRVAAVNISPPFLFSPFRCPDSRSWSVKFFLSWIQFFQTSSINYNIIIPQYRKFFNESVELFTNIHVFAKKNNSLYLLVFFMVYLNSNSSLIILPLGINYSERQLAECWYHSDAREGGGRTCGTIRGRYLAAG